MSKMTHINATVDFKNWEAGRYDLRIPAHQSTKALIINLMETLKIPPYYGTIYGIKSVNKGILLRYDEKIADFPITDGDVLEIL